MNTLGKHRLAILILLVLLLIAVVYFTGAKISDARQQDLAEASQQGFDLGVTNALVAAYQQTANCQVTTITLGNATRQIVDFTCVQNTLAQAAEDQNQ